jgi:hypothetical protein
MRVKQPGGKSTTGGNLTAFPPLAMLSYREEVSEIGPESTGPTRPGSEP